MRSDCGHPNVTGLPLRRPSSLSCHAPALALVLALCVGCIQVPSARAYVFAQSCSTSTTQNPDSPGSVDQTETLCPQCCKVPLNLTFVGTPSRTYNGVGNADKCIILCSTYAFYAVDADRFCYCYDHCSEEAQLTGESKPLVALGNVAACMTPCFNPTSDGTWCNCPSHSSCIPGIRDKLTGPGTYRCCCDPMYGVPTILPDNSSVCMAFELGGNLAGVTIEL